MGGSIGGRHVRRGTRQELTDEFNRQGLWPRIYARQLREQIAAERLTDDPPGGRAQIVKHKDCILPGGTKLVRRG